jgi:hypothetical protein
MDEHATEAEELERQIGRLRAAIREAVLQGDKARAVELRRELRHAEQDWERALDEAEVVSTADGHRVEPTAPRADQQSLLSLREQVHEALNLLTVPAAPRLIATVHEAFFSVGFPSAKLTSLKRDEERSFKTAPFARPYYICAALSADLLAPARGLLALSTWPMEKRVIGSLSPRVDFLSAAVQVAHAVERIPAPVAAARRLLWRFAASIPGAADNADRMEPRAVIAAAEAELRVHAPADADVRTAAARRAREQLDDVEQLFGARLHAAAGSGQVRRNRA